MKVIESRLQSKFSETPDYGGEDGLVVTEHFAAVIDAMTAKSPTRYNLMGNEYTGGFMAKYLLGEAVKRLDPDMTAEEVVRFLDKQIFATYVQYGVVDQVKASPVERFSASMAIYHHKQRKVILAGDCQTLIGYRYYRAAKIVDTINGQARADEINRLIERGDLTEADLLAMDISQDPGRKLIMNPPPNSKFPGLKEQIRHQNDNFSLYGYFMLDGFANDKAPGLEIHDVYDDEKQIVLATDGYIFPTHIEPADALYSLESAEKNLDFLIRNDPCFYKLYKSTKGKGTDPNYDDRAYLRIEI